MKDTACEDTITIAERWRFAACAIWASLLVYLTLFISPLMLGNHPAGPYFRQVLNVYVLYIFLLGVRLFTLSFIPDVNSETDAIRKLFTSFTPFHGLILSSSIVYPVLYKQVLTVLGYHIDLTSYDTVLASGTGILTSVIFLVRNDHNIKIYDDPIGRVYWMCLRLPSTLKNSFFISVMVYVVMAFFCNIFKLEQGSITSYMSWTACFIGYFGDCYLTEMLKNFLSKPIFLGDEDLIGDQLCISGLALDKTKIHLLCFQDLNRVALSNLERRHVLFESKNDQWKFLFEKGIEYIRSVQNAVNGYRMRSNTNNNNFVNNNSGWRWHVYNVVLHVYYLFNLPFDVTFRNELFQNFTIAALASKTLTNFITSSELRSIMLKENYVPKLIEAQFHALKATEIFISIDSKINHKAFLHEIKKHMFWIKTAHLSTIEHLPIENEAKEYIIRLNS